jgi:hypothetical protein
MQPFIPEGRQNLVAQSQQSPASSLKRLANGKQVQRAVCETPSGCSGRFDALSAHRMAGRMGFDIEGSRIYDGSHIGGGSAFCAGKSA